MKQEEMRSAVAQARFPSQHRVWKHFHISIPISDGVLPGLRGPLEDSFTGWVHVLPPGQSPFAFTPDTIIAVLLCAHHRRCWAERDVRDASGSPSE